MQSLLVLIACLLPSGCLQYPVDDDNVILGGWQAGLRRDVEPPQQRVTGPQRVMLALPHFWDVRCTRCEWTDHRAGPSPARRLLSTTHCETCLPHTLHRARA